MKILSLLIFFLSFSSLVFADIGYRSDPWGTKKWVGPGRPPHFLPEKPASPSDRGNSLKKKGHYRSHKHGFSHTPYHRKYNKNRPIIIDVKEKRIYPEIIRKTIIKNRHIPAPQKKSPTICSGDTVRMKNPVTGEITIHYVSAARACK